MKKNLNNIVKLYTNHDGEFNESPEWCLIDPCNKLGAATLCTKEFFGVGESRCKYEVKLGEITCKQCIEIIRKYHTIKI